MTSSGKAVEELKRSPQRAEVRAIVRGTRAGALQIRFCGQKIYNSMRYHPTTP